MRVLPLIFSWLLCMVICHGYRLLGLFPFEGRSHFIVSEQLMKGLARKGHQVDVVSKFPLKKPQPNYTDVVTLPMPVALVNNMSYEFVQQLDTLEVSTTMGGNNLCEYLGHAAIKELAQPKNPPYDAVLIEVFGAQCLSVIAHILKIPLIGISTTSLYPWLPPLISQPENLAFVPNNLLGIVGPMNFWQRLYNTVHTFFNKWYFNYLTTQKQDKIIREHFGLDMPSVRELERKLSLILINSHIALNGIQPRTPAAVDVGGVHVQDENQTLQSELKKWMDDSEEGFVYFTFGSMVLIETFPREFLRVLYASFGKIAPTRVLMKIPNPKKLPPGLPKNIYTLSWMSQIEVLKHPNLKAFITHGGLLSTQEAVIYGVPLIGIPLFADQFMNIDACVARNMALRLDIRTITEKDMNAALNAILWNPLYKEAAQNLSRRFLDRPLNALDTAAYWIEYIIKHGEDSLRSPAMELTWWQLCLVDVIGFLLVCTIITITLLLIFARFILKIINKNYSNFSSSKKMN